MRGREAIAAATLFKVGPTKLRPRSAPKSKGRRLDAGGPFFWGSCVDDQNATMTSVLNRNCPLFVPAAVEKGESYGFVPLSDAS